MDVASWTKGQLILREASEHRRRRFYFDILDEANAGMTAVTYTFPVEVTGGRLVLAFIPVDGAAILSSIKIVRLLQQ